MGERGVDLVIDQVIDFRFANHDPAGLEGGCLTEDLSDKKVSNNCHQHKNTNYQMLLVLYLSLLQNVLMLLGFFNFTCIPSI